MISSGKHLRHDLIVILIITIVMLAVMAVASALDARFGMLEQWSHALYRFVLRQ